MHWIQVVAILIAGCCGQAAASDPLAGLPELASRSEIDRQATALYAARDFDALDARSEGLVADATRTASGLWVAGMFATAVEGAIAPTRTRDEAIWDERERRVGAWLARRPRSALAHLLMAEIIRSRAWSIRGGGYASTVAPEAWAPFRAQLARAHSYLLDHAAVASRHPQYYATLVDTDNALGLDETQVRADFEAGATRYPAYYPLYFTMLNHLMPKWHGGPGEIESFVREVVERSRSTEGEGMYARIYWVASQSGYDDALFFTSYARWDRMRAGFEDVIARYPDQWNLQNYAHFACLAEDTQTLDALLPRLDAPIDDAWTGSASFEACQRLAGRVSL